MRCRRYFRMKVHSLLAMLAGLSASGAPSTAEILVTALHGMQWQVRYDVPEPVTTLQLARSPTIRGSAPGCPIRAEMRRQDGTRRRRTPQGRRGISHRSISHEPDLQRAAQGLRAVLAFRRRRHAVSHRPSVRVRRRLRWRRLLNLAVDTKVRTATGSDGLYAVWGNYLRLLSRKGAVAGESLYLEAVSEVGGADTATMAPQRRCNSALARGLSRASLR